MSRTAGDIGDRPASHTDIVQPTPTDNQPHLEDFGHRAIAIRSVVGGTLIGLANLVPGISGGTMLLAVGLYPQFIRAVAEVSTFVFRPKVLLLLGCVLAADGLAIAGFAGLIGTLLDRHQWAMYCLFIGLTLGGAPLLWRMVKPVDATVMVSATIAVALIGVVAVSNIVRTLLATYERATLGFLLGLLCGAVIGLWPFSEPVPPAVGDIVAGIALATEELVAAVDPADYRTFAVAPSFIQALGGSALAAVGFGVSWGIARAGH